MEIVQNSEGKEENASSWHFSLFPTMFSKTFKVVQSKIYLNKGYMRKKLTN